MYICLVSNCLFCISSWICDAHIKLRRSQIEVLCSYHHLLDLQCSPSHCLHLLVNSGPTFRTFPCLLCFIDNAYLICEQLLLTWLLLSAQNLTTSHQLTVVTKVQPTNSYLDNCNSILTGRCVFSLGHP